MGPERKLVDPHRYREVWRHETLITIFVLLWGGEGQKGSTQIGRRRCHPIPEIKRSRTVIGRSYTVTFEKLLRGCI